MISVWHMQGITKGLSPQSLIQPPLRPPKMAPWHKCPWRASRLNPYRPPSLYNWKSWLRHWLYIVNSIIQVPDEVSSSVERPQRKRLEYQDKAAGPPECCITKINNSTCSNDGVKIIRYVSPHQMSYKQLQQMPTG